MSSEIFSGIFTRSIKVGVLVSIVLFSFSLSIFAFEQLVPYDRAHAIPHDAVDGFVNRFTSQLLPTISFFPHEVYLDEQTRNFTVSVNIENLQASHRLGSVSVRLEYDPTLVSFVGDIRGDFLEDFDRYFLIEMDFPYIWLVNTPPVTSFPEGSGTIWLCSFVTPVLVDTTIRLIGEAVDVEGNVLIQNSSDYCHLIVGEQPEPLPTISFFPNEVYLDEQTRNFTVSVNIENLQASHRFVGIGLQIEYDSTALSFVEMIEGEFLKDFPKIIPLDSEWYGILLVPPWTRFPEGNGTLVAFSFTVSGLLNSTMHLSGHFSDADANAFDLQNIHCDVRSTWNRADLNYDGRVNVLDLPVFAEAFATHPRQYRWNTNVDMDRNQVINIMDAAMIAKNFGKSAT